MPRTTNSLDPDHLAILAQLFGQESVEVSSQWSDKVPALEKYGLVEVKNSRVTITEVGKGAVQSALYSLRVVPTTVEEACATLDVLLNDEDKYYIDHHSNKEICAEFHHSLGTWIRNNWGLWHNSLLAQHIRDTYKIEHADDMSGHLIESYAKWRVKNCWVRLKE